MSNSITLEGKKYVPATFAGKHFGYTKDYLLLLIKNGKIDGQKVGNKWYVNIPSAEVHFTLAKRERDIKRLQLSIDRKRELGGRSEKLTEDKDEVIDTRKNHAILETLVIVIIGLSVGATGYLGASTQVSSVTQADPSFFENLAVALYRFVSGDGETVIVKTTHPAANTVSTSTLVEKKQDKEASFVVAPSDKFSANSVDAVRRSFSDEVEVTIDPENADTGIVVPKFKNTEGDSYRFLMVPVNQSTGS
jgi:hypothetical protein